jgi:hypothetical protein
MRLMQPPLQRLITQRGDDVFDEAEYLRFIRSNVFAEITCTAP